MLSRGCGDDVAALPADADAAHDNDDDRNLQTEESDMNNEEESSTSSSSSSRWQNMSTKKKTAIGLLSLAMVAVVTLSVGLTVGSDKNENQHTIIALQSQQSLANCLALPEYADYSPIANDASATATTIGDGEDLSNDVATTTKITDSPSPFLSTLSPSPSSSDDNTDDDFDADLLLLYTDDRMGGEILTFDDDSGKKKRGLQEEGVSSGNMRDGKKKELLRSRQRLPRSMEERDLQDCDEIIMAAGYKMKSAKSAKGSKSVKPEVTSTIEEVDGDENLSNDGVDSSIEGDDRELIILNITVKDQAEIQAIADGFDILDVDKSGNADTVTVLVNLEDKIALEELFGDRVSVDEAETADLQASINEVTSSVGSASGNNIPGYSCYRTVEGTYATGESIATNYPKIASWTDIGDSWEKTQSSAGGYDVYVLKISNKDMPGDKPVLFLSCAIHAREYATAETCTRFAEMLVEGYDIDADITALIDHHEIHLILVTNPDGRKKAEQGLLWRKNTNNNFCRNSNSRGVDLNRNFPYKWGGDGASTNQCSETFRGPNAKSEPETNNVLNYMKTIFPANQKGPNPNDPSPDDATGVAIDVHSYGGLILYPWGYTSNDSPNNDQFITLTRKLAFYNKYDPIPSVDLYITSGTTQDTYYGDFGVAGLTFELGSRFFEPCSSFLNTVLPDNLNSLMYAAKASRTPFKTPSGPDALDLNFPMDIFRFGNSVTLTATIDDTRYSTSRQSSQDIASAKMYIDIPPWSVGATPIDMFASDGSFDSVRENVQADIDLDTTPLSEGRHIIFVVGTDAGGNQGAFSAIFLDIDENGQWVRPPTMPPVKNIPLTYVGNDGQPADAFPLARCQGDCDSDRDCQSGLTCYQRNGGETVKGCEGSPNTRTDFCSIP